VISDYFQLASTGQWINVRDGTGPYVRTGDDTFELAAPDARQQLDDLIALLTTDLATRGDPLLRVGFGLTPGYERWSMWGNNASVSTGTVPEVVAPLGASGPMFVDGPTSMEIVSSSAADTAAGTGARTVVLEVLDADYNRSFPTVTLNGTTAVALPAQVTAVNTLSVKTVGSGGSNAGILTVRDAGAGTARMAVAAGRNISQNATRVVPAGHTLQIRTHFASINRTDTAGRWITWTGVFQQYVSPGVWDPAAFPLDAGMSDAGPMFFQAEPGLILREKARYWHAVLAVSGNNTDVSTTSWGVLKANSAL
jgi:hypothetical protein